MRNAWASLGAARRRSDCNGIQHRQRSREETVAASRNWPSFAEGLPDDDLFDILTGPAERKALLRLAKLYERNRPDRLAPSAEPTIPKIIHQIWLGSPLPRKLRRWADAWRRRHPQWAWKLWLDRDVDAFDFPTRDLFDSADCWGQKSDLLRAEILNVFGGVYVDLDYQCYKPLDPLAERCACFTILRRLFVAHLGWPAVWRAPVAVCNSLIGAVPGHPILGAYLGRVRSRWDDRAQWTLRRGELTPIAIAALGGWKKAARAKQTGLRTFLPFGETVLELAGQEGRRDLVLPPLLFNPVLEAWPMLCLMPEFWKRRRAKGAGWPSFKNCRRRHAFSMARHLSEHRWL